MHRLQQSVTWLQPGAADVFLDFISYSSGPLAEDLLEEVSCPVSILWGEKDPWEKLEWGRGFQKHQVVEEFVTIPGGTWGQDALERVVRTMHGVGVGLDTADAPSGQQSLPSCQVDCNLSLPPDLLRSLCRRGSLPHGRGAAPREPCHVEVCATA